MSNGQGHDVVDGEDRVVGDGQHGDGVDSRDRDALEGQDSEGLAPAEAFSILGNETRLAILRELWEVDEPMAYGELRSAVAPDDRGNFHYHLGKLTDQFVRKTDDGYELRLAGEQVVRVVLSGTLTNDLSIPSTPIDEQCAFCGAPAEVFYAEERLTVRCTECGGVARGDFPDGTCMNHDFPPAGLEERTPTEIVDAAHVLYDSKVAAMLKGVCPHCAGRTTVSHDVCDEHALDETGLCPHCEFRYAAWSIIECERCRYRRRPMVWFAALKHPAVISFLHDHGLDERLPFRKLTVKNGHLIREVTTEVIERDPYMFAITIRIDDEALDLELAHDFSVRSVHRRSIED